MTFAKQLKAHVGGLICLKTDLYWYDSRSWDGVKGSVYLLLDTTTLVYTGVHVAAGLSAADIFAGLRWGCAPAAAGLVCALLLIDSEPKWILTSKEDLELIPFKTPTASF
jgi:hypothetical protein